jgi:hypothetical protein
MFVFNDNPASANIATLAGHVSGRAKLSDAMRAKKVEFH